MTNDLSNSGKFAVQIIALADAANVYTAPISQQPRTVDKLTKITMSFIRDLVATAHFSFLGANYNPSGPGTKPCGDLQILLKLRDHRAFEISFVGRREIRRLKNLANTNPN